LENVGKEKLVDDKVAVITKSSDDVQVGKSLPRSEFVKNTEVV